MLKVDTDANDIRNIITANVTNKKYKAMLRASITYLEDKDYDLIAIDLYTKAKSGIKATIICTDLNDEVHAFGIRVNPNTKFVTKEKEEAVRPILETSAINWLTTTSNPCFDTPVHINTINFCITNNNKALIRIHMNLDSSPAPDKETEMD